MKFVACKAEDIPAIGNPENPVVKLLFDFVESKAEAAEVTASEYSLISTAGSLRGIVQRNRLPVKVIQRQKRLFLIRTDLKKEGGSNDADS